MILPKFDDFLMLANVLLGVGMLCGCTGEFPLKEGGIQQGILKGEVSLYH